MPAPQTEGTNLSVVAEATLGASPPPTSGWRNLDPNSYGDFGAMFKKLARTPISKNRQNQRPILVDMTSGLPFESDLTKDLVDTFLDGAMMAAVKHGVSTGTSFFYPSEVTATGFAVAANGNVPDNYLAFSRNWRNAANNGLKLLAGTSTNAEVKTTGLAVEALPADGAPPTLDIVGYQFAAGDLQIDADGNITTTTKDLTTLGVTVGQWIYLPSAAEALAMGSALYSSASTAYTGFAKIKKIETNKWTLERRSWTVGAATSGDGAKTIRVFFSRFCRNVAIDHADYLQRSYAFEVQYPDLEAGPADAFEYLLGNHLDELVINLPVTSKATCNLSFVGTETEAITTTRHTGPATAKNASTALAVGTSTDLPRLSIADVDESGIATDFQMLKFTFKNNVSGEPILGNLGAGHMAVGRFELGVEAEVIFTSKEIIEAVRDNRAVRIDAVIRNDDFGMVIDVPSVSIDETPKKLEMNKLVKVSAKLSGFMDPTYGCTAGVSVFGYLP